jgi:hypothetical protein
VKDEIIGMERNESAWYPLLFALFYPTAYDIDDETRQDDAPFSSHSTPTCSFLVLPSLSFLEALLDMYSSRVICAIRKGMWW